MDDDKVGRVFNWEALAALGTVAAACFGIWIFSTDQSQKFGATTVLLQTQGAQISSMQAHLTSEDVTLSSLQVQLAGISQQLADMKAAQPAGPQAGGVQR